MKSISVLFRHLNSGLFSSAVFLAVPVLTLVVLGGNLFSGLTPDLLAVEASPLSLDAPTWTVAIEEASTKQLGRSLGVPRARNSADEVLELDTWNYNAINRGLPAPTCNN